MSKALATKNVAAVLLGVAMVFGFAFSFAAPVKADTLSDLQAQVQALLAQIASLQGGSTSTGGACFTFTQNLKAGATSAEVMQVQKFLNSKGFTVSASGAGSAGNETSYFGPATKAAVIKFQNAYAADILTPNGLTAGNGNWYASTRAKANSLCTSTGGNTGGNNGGTTTGGNVTIAAASQPANSLAPEGASRVPFTTFTLRNNSNAAVTITGITVQRTGLGNNAVFSGIVLVDSNNVQIGNSKTLNSNDQATVGDNFTLNAGETKTLTIAGNMAASLDSYAGQVVSLSVVGVNTTATVSGSLPISGASQTINGTLSLGSISTTTSSFDPGSSQNKSIGDMSVRFSGVRFTANSSEDVKLFSIRWRQTGTASSADISNVVTVVNGTSYPTTVSTDGKYYVSVFPGGILIAKGNSADVYVQGDITGSNASSRTVRFDLDKTSDVYFVGQTYGYGIAPTSSDSHLTNGYTTTIQGGSATAIQNASSITSANVPVSVNNTVLGGFTTNFVGEPVSVSALTIDIATSSTGTGLITGITIVDENGAIVAGPQDATGAGTSVTLSDTVTFPLGVHTYTVKGKLPSTFTNGGTVILSFQPSSDWSSPTGQTSGNTVSLPSGTVTMATQTVKGALLSIAAAPTPVAQSIVSGGTGITLGTIQLDASQSGEDIRLNSLPVSFITTTSTADATEFNTCQLYNGATALNTGSNVMTPSAAKADTTNTTTAANSIAFDNSLVIAKGSVTTLSFKCNIVSGTGGTIQIGVNSSNTVTASGVQSGVTVSPTVTTGASGVQTYTTGGSFTAAVDAATSPARAFAAGGTTQVNAGVVKLRASNENVTLTKLGLTLTNSVCGTKSTGAGGSSNGCVNDIVQAVIYDGATPVGTATFVGSNTTATSSLTTTVTLTKDTDKLLTVKVDLAAVGTSAAGGIGDLVKVDPLNAEGLGQSSGSTLRISATGNTNGVQLVKSYPTVALATGACSSTSCNGTNVTLKRFTVTANSAGSIGLNQMMLTISTSSAQVTSAKLYAYQDAGYSSGLTFNGNSGTGQFGATCTPDAATATCTFTNSTSPLQVPAGTTYYFAVLGTVIPGGSATNWSVNTTLNGDTAQTGLATGNGNGYIATSTANVSGGNFVWSDNATTTAVAADVDWFNGYQVPGLPSTGI